MPEPSHPVQRCTELYRFAEWPTPGELFVTCPNCPGPSRTPSLHFDCCLNRLPNDESKVGSLSPGNASSYTNDPERKIGDLTRNLSALTFSEVDLHGSTNGEVEMLATRKSLQEPVNLEPKGEGKVRSRKRKEAEPGSLSSAHQYQTDGQLVGYGDYRADVPDHRQRAIFPSPSEQILTSGVHHPQQQPVVDIGPPHICDVVMQVADEEAAFHQARPETILADLEDSDTRRPDILGEGIHPGIYPGIVIPTPWLGLLKNRPSEAAPMTWNVAGFHMDTYHADNVLACMDVYNHGDTRQKAPTEEGQSEVKK